MRQELIDASEFSENPEAFIAGAKWMERYLNPPSTGMHISMVRNHIFLRKNS